jgi:hypothetical protein
MKNRIAKLIVENADGSIYVENDLSLCSDDLLNATLGLAQFNYQDTDKKVYLKCGYKPIDFFAHRNLTQNDTN